MSTGLAEVWTVAKSSKGGKRPGAGRPKGDHDYVSVKIDRTVAARALFVAKVQGLTLSEFLTELVRPHVDREFKRASQVGDEGQG